MPRLREAETYDLTDLCGHCFDDEVESVDDEGTVLGGKYKGWWVDDEQHLDYEGCEYRCDKCRRPLTAADERA